jgi:hypothetical protein
LSIEGANQQAWLDQCCVYGPAQGVQIGPSNSNVHSGLRSANPQPGHGWYQRAVVTDPNVPHSLSVWIKTDSLTSGVVSVRASDSFDTGTVLAQVPVSGTRDWTNYTVGFTPNTTLITVNLISNGGQMYVDDVYVGPGYNLLTDGDFERHFAKGIPNDDPNANPSLPRPIGTYMNQADAYELDKIVSAAQAHGIAIQMCSCSGPWFTWPTDPQNMTDSQMTQPWFLKSWERNFRYRVARWGYSTAVLAFENSNEIGHSNPSGTPGAWQFLQAYVPYKQATDPYTHEETTSQNSQAYSPQMWSQMYSLANYHWYLDGHLPSLDPDEALTVSRFAWCLRDTQQGTASPYCLGLGLGDGTSWSGPPKPWVWGELDLAQGQDTGQPGAVFLHNVAWAGLFTPIGTVPIDWWWSTQDNTAYTAKLLARKALSAFWSGEAYDTQNFTFFTTPNDVPPGYSGETASSSDSNARVYGMRSADRQTAYLWVQNRNHTWKRTSVAAINPTITIGGLLTGRQYTLQVWNTSTGQVISSAIVTGPSISVSLSGLDSDQAVKIVS